MKDEGGRMKEEPTDLRVRTRRYALRIVALYGALPKATEAQVVGKQLLRSGTPAGAHYREAQRSKSDADFISKIEGGLQELEETAYWLELLEGAGAGERQMPRPAVPRNGRAHRHLRQYREEG
jgi:four helix bundle protein